MLQCKKCHIRLFENNANEEHGELIILCRCGAKNILAPVLINKVALAICEVVAYRD
jgi:hypothetical protein